MFVGWWYRWVGVGWMLEVEFLTCWWVVGWKSIILYLWTSLDYTFLHYIYMSLAFLSINFVILWSKHDFLRLTIIILKKIFWGYKHNSYSFVCESHHIKKYYFSGMRAQKHSRYCETCLNILAVSIMFIQRGDLVFPSTLW